MSREKMTKEKALELAAKLMSRTTDRGATPAEEAAAMEMLQSILAKHDLSMLDVKKEDLKRQGYGVVKDDYISSWKDVPDYAIILSLRICEAFDVKLIRGKEMTRNGIKTLMQFIGQEVDAAIAKYLWVRCCDELYEMAGRDGRREGWSGSRLTTYRANYICAAAAVIGERLTASRKKQVVQDPRAGALIELKGGLIRDFIRETFPHLKTSSVNHSAGVGSESGMRAGSKIDLSTGGIERHNRGGNSGPLGIGHR